MRAAAVCCALALLAGCGERETKPSEAPAQSAATPSPAPSASVEQTPATDKWLGRWTGPEGTFLSLAGGQGSYDITIQNLDGPRSYQGKAAGERIEFDRAGVKEAIRATDGKETGMKWLADKKDCLTIREGEGYCRD